VCYIAQYLLKQNVFTAEETKLLAGAVEPLDPCNQVDVQVTFNLFFSQKTASTLARWSSVFPI
jgi:hypothetical protein